VDVLLQHPTSFARIADQLVQETDALELRLHTELIRMHTHDRAIQAADIVCRGVHETIEPKVVIDTSGDGVAAYLAGASFEQTDAQHLQRPAFIFSLMDVDSTVLTGEGRMRLARRIAGAVREGTLPDGALGAALRATGRASEAFVTIDLEPPNDQPYDPTDPACLTALEMHGRFLATELAAFLRAEVAGFERSAIAAFPTRIGVRESRRIVGEYCIDADDLERGAAFDDAVALATWPRELRENTRGPRLLYPRENRPCQIPLRALRAAALDNLLVAGRCISCSHEAQASLRVIGTCLATGEATGLAAARLATGAPVDAATIAADRQRCILPIAEPWIAAAAPA
ncbi:MAG: FAD-dependent oxidoreductase, partial [Phycisphaeraceae bacterium]